MLTNCCTWHGNLFWIQYMTWKLVLHTLLSGLTIIISSSNSWSITSCSYVFWHFIRYHTNFFWVLFYFLPQMKHVCCTPFIDCFSIDQCCEDLLKCVKQYSKYNLPASTEEHVSCVGFLPYFCCSNSSDSFWILL
jgi:hypothetical protein